jgi:hypothetical protein
MMAKLLFELLCDNFVFLKTDKNENILRVGVCVPRRPLSSHLHDCIFAFASGLFYFYHHPAAVLVSDAYVGSSIVVRVPHRETYFSLVARQLALCAKKLHSNCVVVCSTFNNKHLVYHMPVVSLLLLIIAASRTTNPYTQLVPTNRAPRENNQWWCCVAFHNDGGLTEPAQKHSRLIQS